MSIETGVVVEGSVDPADGTAMHWHLPEGRNAGYLPDSRTLWDILWENRSKVLGFAHSHPGSGIPGPSWEDITTFSAIERGLGRRLHWWICSRDELVFVMHSGSQDKYDYVVYRQTKTTPSWLNELRRLSYQENGHGTE
jgi:proteasome lid subunit RPN8/RPN11